MSKYELLYQKNLIKIQYPLLVHLQWHHAKMFHLGNNVTIVNLWNTIKFLFFSKLTKG